MVREPTEELLTPISLNTLAGEAIAGVEVPGRSPPHQSLRDILSPGRGVVPLACSHESKNGMF
jgi:hypothetical protein